MKCPEDIKKHNDLTQEDRVYVFIDGLDDYLDGIMGEVLRLKPFLNVEEAFAVIRQEDSRKSVVLGKEEENSVVVVVNSQPKYKPRGLNAGSGSRSYIGSKEKCTKYGYIGHTIETCLQVHGEPEWYKELKKKRQHGVKHNTSKVAMVSNSLPFISNGEGKGCNIKGKYTCSFKQFTTDSVASFCKTEKRKERVDFESENDYKLEKGVVAVNILGGNNVGDWIIDSGASDHMTFCEKDLINHTVPRQTEIFNANGISYPVTGGGIVSLSPTMMLTNTLLVLSLSTKLLSVG
ncbi:hypothetical protein Tco_0527394 [Tanacetum coccineum]